VRLPPVGRWAGRERPDQGPKRVASKGDRYKPDAECPQDGRRSVFRGFGRGISAPSTGIVYAGRTVCHHYRRALPERRARRVKSRAAANSRSTGYNGGVVEVKAMPSPFPGMNPYLEHPNIWHDFHESFIPALRGELARQVSPRYRVRIDEHVYIRELSAEERKLVGKPDLSVVPGVGNPSGSSTATIEAPITIEHPIAIEEIRLSYLKVIDGNSKDVVTVIEILSPSNKDPGADRDHYLDKRNRLLRTPTHYVEIDLLRAGPRMPDVKVPPCDYLITVSRWENRPYAGCWPIGLRDPLPPIPIPLRNGDADAIVDLKGVIDSVYDTAHYEPDIYEDSPKPALAADDATWASQVIAKIGRTS